MRLIVSITFAILLLAVGTPALAQQNGWCGYALIEDLAITANQLGVIEAITPQPGPGAHPHELFQYRFNLAHTAVIIEACFNTDPNRGLLVALFQGIGIPQNQLAQMDYSIFQPGGTREASAASARFYIQQNLSVWELPTE